MGDQQVVVTVVTPSKLTDKQKDLFKQLAKETGATVKEQEAGFFNKMRDIFNDK